MKSVDFFMQFIKNKREIGAIAPSSNFLARKITGCVDFDRAKLIVELGAGTGIITRHLAESLRPESNLIVVEPNDEFHRDLIKLKRRNIKIIKGYAEDLSKHIEDKGFCKADYIVSGLPLAAWSEVQRKDVMESIMRGLSDKGGFVQFQYSLQSYRKFKELFSDVQIKFTLMNLPPAFVYSCSI
ncbi:methyltransferase domain-containing protein [Candidatus Pacearchaeota archaeon]|nr:methyltransferase domain-containing protein [Candidatus Pacearchaeota archaeon]